jgi:hypothetical protein
MLRLASLFSSNGVLRHLRQALFFRDSMLIRHKYNATRTEIDGIKFSSKKEAKYYQKLKQCQKEGNLVWFIRQVPFALPGNITYRLDFMEVWKTENPDIFEIKYVEVKGFSTPISVLKLSQIKSIYGILVEVI